MAKKVVPTNSRELSAALLKLDRRAYRHVATTGDTSEYLRIELVKGRASKNLAGYVQCIAAPSGEKSVTPYMVHVNDLALTDFVVFRMAFIVYGKGEIKHPVFERAAYTDMPTDFFMAVNRLDGTYIPLVKTTDGFSVSTVIVDNYPNHESDRMDTIRAKLTALMNALKNGVSKDFTYDMRESVTRDNKGRTAYGQFLDDKGKPDAALKTWKQAQVTAVYGATDGTDPATVS